MGVLILDGWYDLSIASQEVAQEFDLWLKKLDRAAGGIHNPCPSALKLARIFRRQGDFDIDYRYRLLLRPMPISALRDISKTRSAAANGSAASEGEYAAILERAERPWRKRGWFAALFGPSSINRGNVRSNRRQSCT